MSHARHTTSATPHSPTAQSEVLSLQSEVNDLLQFKEQLFILQGDVSVLKEKVRVKDIELERQQGSIQRMISDNDTIQGGLYDKCTAYEKRVVDMQANHEHVASNLRAEVEALKADNTRQTKNNALLQQKLINSQRTLLSAKTEASQTSSAKRQNTDEYTEAIEALKTQALNLGAENASLFRRCDDLTTRRDALVKEVDTLTAANQELKSQNSEQSQLLVEVRHSLAAVTAQYTKERQEAERSHQKKTLLKNELAEFYRLRVDYEQLRNAHKTVQTLYDNDQARLLGLAEELRTAQRQYDTLQDKHAETTALLTSARARIDDEKDHHSHTIASLKAELHSLHPTHEPSRKDHTLSTRIRDIEAAVELEVDAVRRLLLSVVAGGGGGGGVELADAFHDDTTVVSNPSKVAVLFKDLRAVIAGCMKDISRRATTVTTTASSETFKTHEILQRANLDLTTEVSHSSTKIEVLTAELAETKQYIQTNVAEVYKAMYQAVSGIESMDTTFQAKFVPTETANISMETLKYAIGEFISHSVQYYTQLSSKVKVLDARCKEAQTQLQRAREENVATISTQRDEIMREKEIMLQTSEATFEDLTAQYRADLAELQLKNEGLSQIVSQCKLELSDATIELRSKDRERAHERAVLEDRAEESRVLERRTETQRADLLFLTQQNGFLRERLAEHTAAIGRTFDHLTLLARFSVPLMLRVDALILQKRLLKTETRHLNGALATYENHINIKTLKLTPIPYKGATQRWRKGFIAVCAFNRMIRCGDRANQILARGNMLGERFVEVHGEEGEDPLQQNGGEEMHGFALPRRIASVFASVGNEHHTGSIPALIGALLGQRAASLLRGSALYGAFFGLGGAGSMTEEMSPIVHLLQRPHSTSAVPGYSPNANTPPAWQLYNIATGFTPQTDPTFTSTLKPSEVKGLPLGTKRCLDRTLITRVLLESDRRQVEEAREGNGESAESKALAVQLEKAVEREQAQKRVVDEMRELQAGMVARADYDRLATRLRTAEKTVEVVQSQRGPPPTPRTGSNTSRPLTPPEDASEPVFTMIDSQNYRESGRISPHRSRSPKTQSRRVHIQDSGGGSVLSSRSATPMTTSLPLDTSQLDVLRFISRLDERVSQTLKMSKMCADTQSTPNVSQISPSPSFVAMRTNRSGPDDLVPAIFTEPPSPVLRT